MWFPQLERVEVCCIMTIGRYMQHTWNKLEPWTFCASPMPQGEQSITQTAGPVARHHIHPPSSTLSFTPSLTSLSSMICKYTYLTFLLWLSDTSRTRCLDIIAPREVISLEPIDQPLLSDPSCPHLPFVWWLGCPRRFWRYILGNSSSKGNLISYSLSNWSK